MMKKTVDSKTEELYWFHLFFLELSDKILLIKTILLGVNAIKVVHFELIAFGKMFSIL